jgi:hypothetical protein
MPAGAHVVALALEASSLLKNALDQLDQAKAPPDIGALTDQAIARLDEWIAEIRPAS